MAAHLRWISENRPPSDIARFWNALPPVTAERLRGLVLPINWYDFSELIAVDRTIVSLFGAGSTSILRELGVYSARLNLKNATRSGVHEFLANGARMHPRFMDFGTAEYVQTSSTSGRMIHSNYISYSPLYCESAVGYYCESVSLHGVQGASVIESTCQCRGDEACTFVIRWR